MFKTLTAAALALTVAATSFTASATPAKAGNDELAAFLFGAIVLGVIANAANNNSQASTVHVTPPRNNNRPHANYNNRPNRGVVIPANCERTVHINGRNRNVYGAPCLRRNNVPLARINECARTGSINGRNLTYFVKGCLRRNGHHV